MDGKFYLKKQNLIKTFSFWHACKRCNPTLEEDDFLGRRRVGDIWARDWERRISIQRQYQITIKWECE
jgi:hypothetical protein